MGRGACDSSPMTTKLRLADRANDLFPILGFVAAMASLAMPLNAWLVAIILMGAVVAAVHHAEVIAHRVGEPFGTLILALAVTVIEVGLILTLMQAEPEKAQTLARDTVFAAVMVIVNLIMGLCLLSGAIRHHEQRFPAHRHRCRARDTNGADRRDAGASQFYVERRRALLFADPTRFRRGGIADPLCDFALVQTVRHRDYFLPEQDVDADGDGEPDNHAAPPTVQRTAISGALLLASLVAVVLLAKNLSPVMGVLLAEWGAPPAVLGVLIAALILAPEGLAAVRAAKADRLQTSLNLALGSALATIGLTIPAVAVLSIVTDLPISLGLDAKSTVLLFLSLIVASQTLANGRTTVLQGVIHLMLFAIYLFTTFVP
jgi:Ca2+:H+ antiporter